MKMSEKKDDTEKANKAIAEALEGFHSQIIKDGLHAFHHVIVDAINNCQHSELSRHGSLLDSRGVWLALLIAERIHRRTISDHPDVTRDTLLKYIRAAKKVGDAIYDNVPSSVRVVDGDGNPVSHQPDPFNGVRFEVSGETV